MTILGIIYIFIGITLTILHTFSGSIISAIVGVITLVCGIKIVLINKE